MTEHKQDEHENIEKKVDIFHNLNGILAKARNLIGLITVFDAILTGRQSGQKLQCLYGIPIANNFFQN